MNEIDERLDRIEQNIMSINESMTGIQKGVDDIYYLLTGQELPAREPVQADVIIVDLETVAARS